MPRSRPTHERSGLSAYLRPTQPIRLLGRALHAVIAKRGQPPGTLVPHATAPAEPARITVISYDMGSLEEREVGSVDEIGAPDGTVWVNVDGVHDVDVVQQIADRYGLHPLMAEDVVTVGQRPKFEEYEGYEFVVLHMLSVGSGPFNVEEEQIAFALGTGILLTFQERPGDVFEPVRERLRQSSRRIRARGADYLCYALMDAVVDGYFTVLEALGDATEDVDAELTDSPGPATIRRIHDLKRETLLLRRSVWPVREVLASLLRGDSGLVSEETRVYLRDVYDHAVHVIDTTESMREVVGGMIDLYLSLVGHRTNEVMRVLTVMASIFIPLTFLAGVYGMNFQHMPELAVSWAYPALLAVMLIVALGLLIFFQRKGWL